MRLATFTHRDCTRVGVVVGDEIADLALLAPALPPRMPELLAAGADALAHAADVLESRRHRMALSDVHLEAPVLRPGKFLAIGLNYADHIAESGMERPTHPTVFNKQSTCVNAPFDDVHLPRASFALDYEGELAFVIGRRCRHVPRERAHEVIAGYCVANDLSVRDWQLRTPTMTIGKSFDTHGPLGPWLTTADEVVDPHALGLRTWVNDELRQESSTRHLIFDCFSLVEHLSTAFTLEPGDVISTGTPGGVGIVRQPPVWLRAGDVVRVEVEHLGSIEQRVVAEPDTARI